jgi:hypothetical protein
MVSQSPLRTKSLLVCESSIEGIIMNKIHTMAHIRTHRMLKGFHACVNMTGKSEILTDLGRVCSEEYQRMNRVQKASGKRILLRRKSL